MELKDKMAYVEESIFNLEEKTTHGPQQIDEMIHPIRELVSHVTDIKKANVTVASGMSTLHQMLKNPRNLACVLPESAPKLPYEPLIKDAFVPKKQTVGRKPLDRPEEREDLSRPKKPLTKLQKMQLLRQKEMKTSRDTSPGSGVESEKSYTSSVSGLGKKLKSIPDHSPAVSTHKMESIPKHPLKR